MDSGNSGSLQSSSSEEEYDSRADSISAAALMTTHHHHHPHPAAAAHHGPISNNPQQPPPTAPPLNTTNTSSIYDPLSNYFDTISRPPQNPNSALLNLDMPWSKTLRSDSNSTEFNSHPMMVSASSIHQSLFGSNQQLGSVSIPPAVTENTSATNTPRQAPQSDQKNPPHVLRNPKKRSRASRRAPTTVLTTDTTNFRAMVQEFTGIPAPPFTSSSTFLRARLDLYGASSPTMRSNNPLDSPQQTPYLCSRPFPQKVQLPPPFFASSSPSSSSSLVDHAAIDSPNTTNNNIITSTNTYPLPPQSANLFNFRNPILTSLLQSNNAKYQPTNCSIIGSKTPQDLGEFGLSQGHVKTTSLSGLPGRMSSDQTTSRNNDNNPVNWGSSTGIVSNDGGDQGHRNRSGNGNFSLSRINNATAAAANGKLNYSGSSSSFHGDKGSSDTPPTRGEGMMESWISSSD